MSGYIGNIPVPQSTQTRDNFTATSGQTTFSTSGYTPSYLDVYLNGVHLDPSDYTATNGTDVVLGAGARAGDVLEVVAFSTFETVDQDFSGDFSVDGSTFVVDSTNNRVGIGTSSPTTTLDVTTTIRSNANAATNDATVGKYSFYNTNASASANPERAYIEAGRENSAWGAYLKFGTSTGTSAATERMRIDSSGRVTMPYQPAFYASFGGDGNIGNMDQVHATLTNVGNHFNSSNGSFTAPVDGVYLFNADVMTASSGGTSYGAFYFTVNGTNTGSLHHSHSDATESYRNTSGSAVLSLSANDVVRVRTYYSPAYGTNALTPWSGFSGYLLG